MKEGIHPKYYDCVVACACGNRFTTRSTLKEIHVEICSNCHPFFTGKQKLVDTAGRVERYRRKYATQKEAEEPKTKTAGRKSQKATAKAPADAKTR